MTTDLSPVGTGAPARLRIGFIPLADAAALLVAVDKGFARAQFVGLDVELVREISWSNVRDRLNIGRFDAAHLLYNLRGRRLGSVPGRGAGRRPAGGGAASRTSPIEWLKPRFALARVPAHERGSPIAGGPIGGEDEGDVVCACFQVGRARILTAGAAGARSPAAIRIATRAGTNCGSCLPELKGLASVMPQRPAAE